MNSIRVFVIERGGEYYTKVHDPGGPFIAGVEFSQYQLDNSDINFPCTGWRKLIDAQGWDSSRIEGWEREHI